MEKNYKNYFKYYLISISVFAVFWLYLKHSVGNDSTISEWIINYQGGFTRRGLPGEIAFHIALFLDLKLRFVILLMQIFFYLLYIFLIYKFFKKVKTNAVILFALFTPIFLIYHVAELEVLARKELFLFIGFIWFYNISTNEKNVLKPILWIIFVLPLVTTLYEPAVFYYSFFAAVIILKMKDEKPIKIFSIIFFIFLPSVTISWFSAFSIISKEGFEIMKTSLMDNFGETCYMSCGLMDTKREAIVHIKATIDKLTEKENSIYIYLFRYFLIMLIGCAPLFLLIKNSEFKKKVLKFKKLILVFIILNIFVPIHWLMFIDWGRAVNITYVSSILFFFYLYKNDYISINFLKIKKIIDKFLSFLIKIIFLKSKKALATFVFIIYAFGWSPPTLLSADINSFPGYRIPYKTIKFLSLNHLGYNIFYFYKN